MRRRGRWGWPAPGGRRRSTGRSMAGTCGGARRSIAVMSLAGRSLPDGSARNPARASCPRCPRAASLFAGIGLAADSGRTARTGPAVPVPCSPGNLWRGCERWPCRSDFQGGTVSDACPAGEYGHRLRQAGGSAACPAGSRTAVGQWDAAGLSCTSWDMIQNLRRSDQAHSEVTDVRRTGRGFHAARNGVAAGQRLFRWVGMGGL